MRLRYRYVTYGAGPTMLDHMQAMHQLMHQMMVRATPGVGGAWQPATNIYESDDAVVVQTELAGVREEDIDITLFADHLAITGLRHNNVPPGSAAYHLAGILYGEFRVEVPMVARVLREEVEASFENGLLVVVLPKAIRRDEPTTVRIGQGSNGAAITAGESVPEGVNHAN